MAGGWIKLHRKLLDSPLWKDCNDAQRVVMLTVLLLANHESNKWIYDGVEYEVKPGQFITSLKSLSDKSNTSIQSVRSALLKFEKYGFSTSKSTNKNRLISIDNWEKYQGEDDEPNKPANKQPTSSQQAANKQPTTNKNDKNDKNVKNNIYSDSAEKIYNSYITNKKRYPDKTKKRIIELVKKYGEEQILRAVNRYVEQVKGTELRYIKESDGFFNEEYIFKYLDQNYKKGDNYGSSGEASDGYNLKIKTI